MVINPRVPVNINFLLSDFIALYKWSCKKVIISLQIKSTQHAIKIKLYILLGELFSSVICSCKYLLPIASHSFAYPISYLRR